MVVLNDRFLDHESHVFSFPNLGSLTEYFLKGVPVRLMTVSQLKTMTHAYSSRIYFLRLRLE